MRWRRTAFAMRSHCVGIGARGWFVLTVASVEGQGRGDPHERQRVEQNGITRSGGRASRQLLADQAPRQIRVLDGQVVSDTANEEAP